MPRQTLLSAFAFLAPMSDWKIKEDEEKLKREQEQEYADNDLFGCLDAISDDEKDSNFIRSHFLPLISTSAIFYVMTPMVAMTTDDFEPLDEEDLALFQLTPTLDFTLALNLNFHGNDDRSSRQMFSSLGKIRFLRLLKIQGRISTDDLVQIGQLYFLESLDLSKLVRFTDDDLIPLRGLVNLKQLDLSNWTRLTKKGFAEISKIAPKLEYLVLQHHDKLTWDSLSTIVPQQTDDDNKDEQEVSKSPSSTFARSLKKVAFKKTPVSETTAEQFFSKLPNLTFLKIDSVSGFPVNSAVTIVKNCLNLRHIDLRITDGDFRVLKALGQSPGCSERVEFLSLNCRLGSYQEPEKCARYLVRYFHNLDYVDIASLTYNYFQRFLRYKYGEELTKRAMRACYDENENGLVVLADRNKEAHEYFLGSDENRRRVSPEEFQKAFNKRKWYRNWRAATSEKEEKFAPDAPCIYPHALRGKEEIDEFYGLIKQQSRDEWNRVMKPTFNRDDMPSYSEEETDDEE